MRKTKRFIAILLAMVALGGCGSSNKSDAELTDREEKQNNMLQKIRKPKCENCLTLAGVAGHLLQ